MSLRLDDSDAHSLTPLGLTHSNRVAQRPRVLIVEDDCLVRAACATIAGEIGFDSDTADSVSAAWAVLHEKSVDVVLLDVRLGEENGLTLLNKIRAETSSVSVVIMTAFPTVNSAVTALRAGATDYIQKPFSIEELTEVLESARHQALSNDAKARSSDRTNDEPHLLIGRAPSMKKLRRLVSRVAVASHPVLILGEQGTEKELVGRSIHMKSPTCLGPFMSMDCSALSEGEIEFLLFGSNMPCDEGSESLGCERTSPTERNRTVFVSEIDRLSLAMQSRLLNALDKRSAHTNDSSKVDFNTTRIIASSSNNLEECANAGRFRKDLFHRLSLVRLHIPPLRERKADIPEMSTRILNRISLESRQHRKFGKNVIRCLVEYDWPGNLRELENVIEYACLVSDGPEVHQSDLPKHINEHSYDHVDYTDGSGWHYTRNASESYGLSGEESIAEMERKAILKTLKQLNGDKLQTAKVLGIGKTTLYRKLKEYAVEDLL
jgi:two-component system response regulator HydG